MERMITTNSLEKIKLRDFQCHKKLVIELDPEITTITGVTDSGKSSIVRALKWLCFNKPRGGSFINWSAKSTFVGLIVDGVKITRGRGEGENTYKIAGKELHSFGTQVPEEIKKLLNIGEQNFQSQHDSPYWFMQSAGDFSKELNHIVNLDLIDKCLSNAASMLRDSRSVISISEQRLHSAKLREEALFWVKSAHESLVKVESLASIIEEISNKQSNLRLILKNQWEYQEVKKNYSNAVLAGRKVVFDGKQAIKISDSNNRMRELVDGVVHNKEKICQAEKELESIRTEIKMKMKGTCPLCGNQIVS